MKKKKKILPIILTILILIALFVLYFLSKDTIKYTKDRKVAENIKNEIEELMEVEKTKENNNENIEPKYSFDKIKEKYPDVTSFIYIDDIGLSYPISQANDNEYYLYRDLNGNPSDVGTIFVDYQNKSDFSDTNTIIYGHNMREGFWQGDAFGKLDHYVDDNFRQNADQIIKIRTPEKTYFYKIIAGYNIRYDSDYRQINPHDPREYIENIIKESQIDFGERNRHISEDDKIITLSTCINSLDDDYRFVIHAIKINEIEN